MLWQVVVELYQESWFLLSSCCSLLLLLSFSWFLFDVVAVLSPIANIIVIIICWRNCWFWRISLRRSLTSTHLSGGDIDLYYFTQLDDHGMKWESCKCLNVRQTKSVDKPVFALGISSRDSFMLVVLLEESYRTQAQTTSRWTPRQQERELPEIHCKDWYWMASQSASAHKQIPDLFNVLPRCSWLGGLDPHGMTLPSNG